MESEVNTYHGLMVNNPNMHVTLNSGIANSNWTALQSPNSRYDVMHMEDRAAYLYRDLLTGQQHIIPYMDVIGGVVDQNGLPININKKKEERHEMKFKVGDRVKRIDGSNNGMKIGDEGTVEKLTGETTVKLTEFPGPDNHNVNKLSLVVASATPKNKENRPMFDSVKKYFQKHQEIFYTIAVALVVDHYVFNGAFRKKIEALVERLLDGASDQMKKLNENNSSGNTLSVASNS